MNTNHHHHQHTSQAAGEWWSRQITVGLLPLLTFSPSNIYLGNYWGHSSPEAQTEVDQSASVTVCGELWEMCWSAGVLEYWSNIIIFSSDNDLLTALCLQCELWRQCGAEETNPCCEAASPGLDNTWPSIAVSASTTTTSTPAVKSVSASDKHPANMSVIDSDQLLFIPVSSSTNFTQWFTPSTTSQPTTEVSTEYKTLIVLLNCWGQNTTSNTPTLQDSRTAESPCN